MMMIFSTTAYFPSVLYFCCLISFCFLLALDIFSGTHVRTCVQVATPLTPCLSVKRLQTLAERQEGEGSLSDGRLRVVSNFGDCDCGAGKIHTRARESSRRRDAKGAPKFSALPLRRVSSIRARACVFCPPHNRHRQNQRLLAVYSFPTLSLASLLCSCLC